MARIVWRTAAVRGAIKRDPEARIYLDQFMTPLANGEFDGLEMFNLNRAARAAAGKAKRRLTVA